MRKKYTTIIGSLLVLLLGMTFYLSCDFQKLTDLADEFDVIIELEPINTRVLVNLIDVSQDDFVNKPVALTFKGDYAATVVDVYNDPISGKTVENGIFSFGIDNLVVPTQEEPVALRIVAKAEGYNVNSKTIEISSTGTHAITILMTPKSQVATGGVTGQSTDGQAQNGTVTTAVTAQTSTNQNDQTSASVSVPAGTQATTSTGQPAQGQLTTTVQYYSSSDSTVDTGAMAGGGSGGGIVVGGVTTDDVMTTMGWTEVTITDGNGNEITEFSTPIEISIELPPNTLNPSTGAMIQNGDVISAYSFDEEEGNWVYEGPATVSGPLANGNFKASYFTTHLSVWNFGFTYGNCTANSKTPPMIYLVNNEQGGTLTLAITSPSIFAMSVSKDFTADENEIKIIGVPDLPASFSFSATLSATHNGETKSTPITSSPCGQNYNFTFTPPPNPSVDVTFKLVIGEGTSATTKTKGCRILNVTAIPTGLALSYKKDGSGSNWQVLSNPAYTLYKDAQDRIGNHFETGKFYAGTVVIPSLQRGAKYHFKATLEDKVENQQINVPDVANPSVNVDIINTVKDNCGGGN